VDYTCILFLITYERKLEELIQDPFSGLLEIKGKKRRQEKDPIKIRTCNFVEGEGTEMKRKEREFSLFVHRFFSYELENLNFKNKKA